MPLPDSLTFTLNDVCGETQSWSLPTAFQYAVASKFDPRYEGAKDRLSNFRNYGISGTIVYRDIDGSDVAGYYQVDMCSNPNSTYYYGIDQIADPDRISAFSIDQSTGNISYKASYSAPTDFVIRGIALISDGIILFLCQRFGICRVYSLGFNGTSFEFNDMYEVGFLGSPYYGTDIFTDGYHVYIKPEDVRNTDIRVLNVSSIGLLSLNAETLDLGTDIGAMQISTGNSMLYLYTYINSSRRIYAYHIDISTGSLTYRGYFNSIGTSDIKFLETNDEDIVFAADQSNIYILTCSISGTWALQDTASINTNDISYNRTRSFLIVGNNTSIYCLRLDANLDFVQEDVEPIEISADSLTSFTANNSNPFILVSYVNFPASYYLASYEIT